MTELWVPSARIGGYHPGGVALGRFLEGGVELSKNILGRAGFEAAISLIKSQTLI